MPQPPKPIDARKLAGAIKGGAAVRQEAHEAHAPLWPLLLELREAGSSFANIAAELNHRGIKTRRRGPWSATAVRNVFLRLQARESKAAT